MNNNIGTTLNQTNTLHSLITAIRLETSTGFIRICNWSERIYIIEPEDGTSYEYLPYPFNPPDLSRKADKSVPRISITLPISPTLYSLIKTNVDDSLGKQVTLFYTNKDLLNISQDKFIMFKYTLSNLTLSTHNVTLTLSINFSLHGLQLPRRRFARGYCQWQYKDGKNCTYDPVALGGKYFDVFDNPTTDPNLDQCSKTLRACILRAIETRKGYTDEAKKWYRLPFGGFPAIPERDPRKL